MLVQEINTDGWIDNLVRFEPFSPEKLKELRTERRVTQDQLASESGISLSNIKKWESGVIWPSADNLLKLGKFFKVYFFLDWEKTSLPDDEAN